MPNLIMQAFKGFYCAGNLVFQNLHRANFFLLNLFLIGG